MMLGTLSVLFIELILNTTNNVSLFICPFSQTVKNAIKFREHMVSFFSKYTYLRQFSPSVVNYIFPSRSFLFPLLKARSLSSINKTFYLLFYFLSLF